MSSAQITISANVSIGTIGPIISSAMVAAINSGDAFSKGRDFGAWLGLVPKQMSTGDRTISAAYQSAAIAICALYSFRRPGSCWSSSGPKQWDRYGLKSWIEAAKKRLHHNVLAIALANKLARIAWAVLHNGRALECVRTNETASQPA
jgi:transposase